mgnify:CR=1 FL=1
MEKHMHMVGHHDVMPQPVTLAIKAMQRLFHDGGERRIAEGTIPVAFIKPTFQTGCEVLCALLFLDKVTRFRMPAKPFVYFRLPLGKLVGGNGICQPEGHEIGAAVLLPVRQVPNSFCERSGGIEGFEWQRRNLVGAWLTRTWDRRRACL